MLHDTVKYEAHFKYIVDDVSPKRPTTQTTCRLNASSPKRRVTNRSHIISADPHDTLALAWNSGFVFAHKKVVWAVGEIERWISGYPSLGNRIKEYILWSSSQVEFHYYINSTHQLSSFISCRIRA